MQGSWKILILFPLSPLLEFFSDEEENGIFIVFVEILLFCENFWKKLSRLINQDYTPWNKLQVLIVLKYLASGRWKINSIVGSEPSCEKYSKARFLQHSPFPK